MKNNGQKNGIKINRYGIMWTATEYDTGNET